MADLHDAIAQHKDLSADAQKKAGQATGSDMDAKHKSFLADIIAMIDQHEISVLTPSSMLKQENYGPLSQDQKDAIDYSLLNIAGDLRHIEAYFRSTQTPNASPQLQTMIDMLWDKKSRLEEKYGDVLKF